MEFRDRLLVRLRAVAPVLQVPGVKERLSARVGLAPSPEEPARAGVLEVNLLGIDAQLEDIEVGARPESSEKVSALEMLGAYVGRHAPG